MRERGWGGGGGERRREGGMDGSGELSSEKFAQNGKVIAHYSAERLGKGRMARVEENCSKEKARKEAMLWTAAQWNISMEKTLQSR
jgi:hypothetical protein